MPTRIFLGVLFAAIFYFIFLVSDIFAAPSITISSIPSTLTVSEPFTLNANASGLATGSSYYTKIRIGTTSGTLYKGQTYNPSTDDWLSWNSSWTGFPQITSDANGNWSGAVTGRPSDGAFAGLNIIILSLRKTDSSTSYDSATVAAQVNAAPTQTTQDISSPKISVTMDDNLFLGEEFPIKLTLKNFDPNQNYYLKFRAGTDESSLAKAQTKNGSAFYGDSESWSKFPEVATDGLGKFEGQIMGRISEDKPSGKYYVRVRVHKKDGDTFYDSETKTIQFVIPVAIVAENPAATKTAAVDKTINTTTDEIDLILGTASAATVSPIVGTGIPVNQVPKSSGIFPVAIIFVVLGTTLSSLALLSVKFRIWEKWLGRV